MKKEQALIKNTIIYMIGSFGTKILVFLLVPIYSHMLPAEEYGTYDFFCTIISVLAPIISILIESAVYRYLLVDADRQEVVIVGFKNVVRNLLIGDCIGVCLFFIFEVDYLINIMLVLNTQILQAYLIQCARGLKRNEVYAVASIIYTSVFCVSNIVGLVILNQNYSCLYNSAIIANILSMLYIEYKTKIVKYSIQNWSYSNKSLKKQLIRYSFPLVINSICWTIMSMSDRIIITYALGNIQNGIYAMANKFPAVIISLNSIFYLAWSDSAVVEKNSEDFEVYYNKIYNVYTFIQLVVISLLLVFNKPLFYYVLGGEYFEGYKLSLFLYLGALFYALSSFIGAYYNVNKITQNAAKTSVVGAIINIVINIILIREIGIMAAAISTAVAYVVMFILRYRDVCRSINIKLGKEHIVFLIWLVVVPFFSVHISLAVLFLLNLLLIILLFNRYIKWMKEYLVQWIRRKS